MKWLNVGSFVSDPGNGGSPDIRTDDVLLVGQSLVEDELLHGIVGGIQFRDKYVLKARPHRDAEHDLGEEIRLVQHRPGMAKRAETVLRILEIDHVLKEPAPALFGSRVALRQVRAEPPSANFRTSGELKNSFVSSNALMCSRSAAVGINVACA